jgi:hypothetical protein
MSPTPQLISLETTPNPNSMKLNLSGPLGVSGSFDAMNGSQAPELLQQLLAVEGVVSVFTAQQFITLNRDPRASWEPILTAARAVLGAETPSATVSESFGPGESLGQVQVAVQTFRGVPVQVKVTDGVSEQRVGLSARFGEAARTLQARFAADYLKERHWADWGIRYGDLETVATQIAEEIETLLDPATLSATVLTLLGETAPEPPSKPTESLSAGGDLQIASPHWPDRFRAVQQLEASEATLPLLIQALADEKPQIRRWAAAKLAAVPHPQTVAALSRALTEDPDVGVRRTAGDSLSDIGDAAAQPAVCQALRDPNKLVRWRAARFLAEVGTPEALSALEAAQEDPEFEVRLEIQAAITHIRQGSQAEGPVWKRMNQESPSS